MSIAETQQWWHDLWRFYLRIMPLLVLFTLIFAAAATYFGAGIESQLATAQAQAASANQQSQIQGRLFETFISAFVTQNNYICRVVTVRAEQDHLPLPPPGLCSIKAP